MEMINFYARNYRTDFETINENKKRPQKWFPSLLFYYNVIKIVGKAGHVAKKTKYTAEHWVKDSYLIAQNLEKVGCEIIIEGYENVEQLNEPCVFVSNHSSTLETFVLPCIIEPTKDVTFVVKESLLKYPGLGPVLSARDPIALTRTNPKLDLANVLENGQKILESGRSIIIFPQGTRYPNVDSENFSSLGVKLAKKAKVPVMPIALKTDAWGTSSITKDFGKISPHIPINFCFGKPMEVTGNGKDEHNKCLEFIQENFKRFSESIKNHV